MKTKLAATALILAMLAPAAMAKKYPNAAAMQNMKDAPLPAIDRSVLAKPGFRAPRHDIARDIIPAILPEITTRLATPAAPRRPAAQNILPGNRKLNATPVIPSRNLARKPAIRALDGIDSGKLDAVREGARIANGLESVDQLRRSGLGNDLPRGLPEFTRNGNGVQKPMDPFAENHAGPRTPTAPGHISSNLRGGGLTDIRGGMNGSRRGSQGTTDDLSRTTRSVVDSSSRMTFGNGPNSTASGPVVVNQDENTGDFTATQTGTDANGNQARIDVTQHTNGSGQVTGTTEIITTSNGETTSTHTIERDATGAVLSDKTEKTTPGTQACDRGTGDIATGGPVGPGAAAITGLVPLDLLRQGHETTTATNTMVTGRLGNNQVNPGSRSGMAPVPGSQRNNIGHTIDGLAGPMSGGSNGGGDRPD
jgi:hypothetical protein